MKKQKHLSKAGIKYAAKWSQKAGTDKELAKILKISEGTLRNYRKESPEFKEATSRHKAPKEIHEMKKDYEIIDRSDSHELIRANIITNMIVLAEGTYYKESKTIELPDGGVIYESKDKYLPPSLSAQKELLKIYTKTKKEEANIVNSDLFD